MRKYIRILVSLAFVVPLPIQAQRTAKVEGEYTFVVGENDNITLFEAKRRTIELAKNEAIKQEFGTVVTSDFIGSSAETDGKQVGSFSMESTGMSVKGEWLADRQPAEVKVEYIDGKLYFTAHVWGEAREIVKSKTDIRWILQCDGPNGREATTRFVNGQRFYIDFQSPTDGYLAVYMIEGNGDVSCLLPYPKSNTGRYQINGGYPYILFDKEHDPAARYYKLTTQHAEEGFQFVVIFSPNPFTKCVDTSNDPQHPNSLNNREFQSWLIRSQRNDNEMVVDRRWVKVSNPNDGKENTN